MKHPIEFDEALTKYVAVLPKSFKPFMTVISSTASPIAIGLVFAVLALNALMTSNTRLWHAVLWGAALMPIAGVIKLLTRRRRPETLYVERMWVKTYSFPSGHAYLATTVFGFFAVLAVQGLAYGYIVASLLVALAFLVGVSRVYLGAHFPSDVLAGWALGFAVLLFWVKVGY